MNYYEDIKNKLIDNEVYSRVKDYSKERNKVITYYEVGRILSEAGKHYGDSIINEYSKKLVMEVGKKYNRRTLFRMRQFYNKFNNEKVSTLSTQLTWSHFTELLPIKNHYELLYYYNLCLNQHLDVRSLRKKIHDKEYSRLPVETRNKLRNDDKVEVIDLIPNPILIRYKNNVEIITEKVLQKLILENIPSFLKELGTGFTFIENEYKIKIGDRYNYIDLLLFNITYNCYVVIELKVTELKKEHIGQIQVYMNYIDKNIKSINHDKTIGIIICKKNNKYVIEYCSDNRVISRTYMLI